LNFFAHFRLFDSFPANFTRFHPFLAVSTRSQAPRHVCKPFNVYPILFTLTVPQFRLFLPIFDFFRYFGPFSFVFNYFWLYRRVPKLNVTPSIPTTHCCFHICSLLFIFDIFHPFSTFSFIFDHFHSFTPVFGRINAFSSPRSFAGPYTTTRRAPNY
jgi:hypothetical protein